MKPIEIIISKNDSDPSTCKEVRININTQLPIEKCCWNFILQVHTQTEAELLMRHLDKLLDDSIEQAHRNAYLQGWADAKAKRRKKDCFAVTLTEGDMAW